MQNRKLIIDNILPANGYGYHFRLVELEDAEFIHSLRNNEKLARFINPTSTEIEDQIKWLKEYKIRESKGEDFYVMCLKEDKKTKMGLTRIYNVVEDVFEFGSWLFSPDAGPDAAVLGELFTKGIAFEHLGFKVCKMETSRKNTTVVRYAKSYKPKITGEDETTFYHESDYDNFKYHRQMYLKIFRINT